MRENHSKLVARPLLKSIERIQNVIIEMVILWADGYDNEGMEKTTIL